MLDGWTSTSVSRSKSGSISNHGSNGTIASRKGSGARNSSSNNNNFLWNLNHLSSPKRIPKATTALTTCVVLTVLSMLLVWFGFLHALVQQDKNGLLFFHGRKWKLAHPNDTKSSDRQINQTVRKGGRGRNHQSQSSSSNNSNNPFCSFRRYPMHRYYQLQQSQKQPNFLTSASTEYIYGLWPVLLQEHESPLKLCVDQKEWWNPPVLSETTMDAVQSQPKTKLNANRLVWPFADGTNPSILHMDRVQKQAPAVAHQLLQHYPTVTYIVTVCMTNSQCTWKDQETKDTIIYYDLPNLQQSQPDTVRTVLQLLDESFQKLTEATVWLHRDAPWGKLPKIPLPPPHQSNRPYHLPALDDARLFLHRQQIYVSYREGPGFGYESQVLNPIHFQYYDNNNNNNHIKNSKDIKWTATIVASETSTFCCGRNMALMPDFVPANSLNPQNDYSPLHALTWVDPVTVIQVDTTPVSLQPPPKARKQKTWSTRRRRLVASSSSSSTTATTAAANPTKNAPESTTETVFRREPQQAERPQTQRRLAAAVKNKHKSHIHGTNAFMVPLPSATNVHAAAPREFLGVAHFHRPNDRKPNSYARFGHHYTHAFYTVSPMASADSSDSASSPSFRLTGLSPEFVLPAVHQPDDAEMIQFVSGLEYNPATQQIILAYGINDCEGAVTTLDLDVVRNLLRPVVETGQQVVDFMRPLQQPPPSL